MLIMESPDSFDNLERGYFLDHATPHLFQAIFPRILDVLAGREPARAFAASVQESYAHDMARLAGPAVDPLEPVTLRFWHQVTSHGGGSDQGFLAIIKSFQQRYPNVTVEPRAFQFEEMLEQATVERLRDEAPDLLHAPPMYLSGYVQEGLVCDLTAPAVRYDWITTISRWALNYLNYRFNGQIYGISLLQQFTGIYTNIDLLRRVGLEIPRTFEQLEEALARLKAAGITPLMLGSANGVLVHIFYELIHCFESRARLTALMIGRGEASWTDPSILRALEKLKEWVDAGYFNSDYASLDYAESLARFAQGGAAMYITGSWAHHLVLEGGDKIKFAPFPRPEGMPPVVMASPLEAWVIPLAARQRGVQVWAERLLNWMLRPESLRLFYESGFSLTVNADTRSMRALPGQREMEQTVATLRSQVAQLSAPIVPLTDRIRLLPIIGQLDEERAQLIMEQLLEKIGGAAVMILDITGLSGVDLTVAQYLIQATRVMGLVGTEGIIVGVQPEVAQSLVMLNMDLGSIRTFSDLQQGLEYALRRTRTILGNGAAPSLVRR
jgi:ABC-type glycerol-3-phosphate transport system substrate-binding protein